MSRCAECESSQRSTWEVDPCPRFLPRDRLTNADLAVRVLEQSPGPLSLYDILRGFEREVGWTPSKESLNVSVANDLRCCWAGRGLYAMYRHGFIPGPRRLLDVARVVLVSHGEPLHLTELNHVMKDLGYRFQEQSIRAALVNSIASEVQKVAWLTFTVDLSPAGVARLSRAIRMSRTKAGMDAVLEDVGRRVEASLHRRARVLRRSREGLRPGDPIYKDGSQPLPPF